MKNVIDLRDKSINRGTLLEAIENANLNDIPQEGRVILAKKTQKEQLEKIDNFIVASSPSIYGIPIEYDN